MRNPHPPAGFAKQVVSVALCCMLTGMPLHAAPPHDPPTTTPIKHIVVIFQENRSFDQYFGTYPYAANLPGEPPFHARPDTSTVNGLTTAGLLTANPNSANPQRLSPADAIVCSDSHDYSDEQNAFDHGLMDMFPEHTASSGCPLSQVVDYFDGNTVTALWNYAQHFAMSDNSFNTTFGPSAPGASQSDLRSDSWCGGLARKYLRRRCRWDTDRRCRPSL